MYKTHGLRHTKIHSVWHDMKTRCYNKNCKSYKRYGERGITVCEEWRNDFKAFYDWAMANGYKEGLTIDRIDVNGNYEPKNCRFVTAKVQSRNTSRNQYVTCCGQTKTIAEWAEIKGMKYFTLWNRIYRLGWNVEKAVNTPGRVRC